MTDQELIAYLDSRFQETSRQIRSLGTDLASFREETHQRFEQVDQRFQQVDRRFQEVDQRFQEMDRRFQEVDQRFQEMDQRFQEMDRRFQEVDRRFEKAEETARQTLVLVENLRDKVQLLAEGFMGLNDRLERHQIATVTFDQVKEWLEPYFRTLNGKVSGMDGRVSILEGRSERLQGNVMDAVRKLTGRAPLEEPPIRPPKGDDTPL
jgi:chromosome segregation ATPase